MIQNFFAGNDFLKSKRTGMSENMDDVKAHSSTTVFFHVEGMTCAGCKRRIEEAVKKLKGITECTANYRKSTVSVRYLTGLIDEDAIKKALGDIGYGLTHATADPEAARKTFYVKQLLGIGIAIAMVFLVFQKTGLLNRIPQINESMSYGILLLVGLLTSFHCIAMCGGINLSQSVRGELAPQEDVLSKIKPALFYNTARVVSYTVIGGIVGALGSVLSFSGKTKGFLVIAVGAIMILMGLNMLNLFPWLRRPFVRLFRNFTRNSSSGEGSRGNGGPLTVGLLNGLMPCGPLQAMQLYALGTGSFVSGALSMFLFSIGTIPLMFGMGALSSLLSRRFAHTVLKVSAMLVIVLGITTLGRGMTLSGTRVGIFPEKVKSIASIQGGIQIIATNLEPYRYAPIIVQKGLPVQWTINATASSLNGCNNPVTIPKYKIVRSLETGTNVIEFTPMAAGDITYTCWMGMISSVIRVVDNLAAVSNKDVRDVAKAGNSTSDGSCCSTGGGASFGSDFPYKDVSIPTKNIEFAKITGGIQYVSIDALKKGYSPAVVVMQRDVPTRWVLNGQELTDENYRIIFPAYRARMELAEGKNTIEFTPQIDFFFYSWKYSYFGYVTVVDSIVSVSEKEVRSKVKDFVNDLKRNGT
jgi:sulfite exporter TauE/SafE/copper chaperone CopZ